MTSSDRRVLFGDLRRGDMVVITELPPPDPMQIPQVIGRVGSVEQVESLACVYTDGWLRLCFESGIGGMGGIKCRVRIIDKVAGVLTLRYSGWGPDEIPPDLLDLAAGQ